MLVTCKFCDGAVASMGMWDTGEVTCFCTQCHRFQEDPQDEALRAMQQVACGVHEMRYRAAGHGPGAVVCRRCGLEETLT